MSAPTPSSAAQARASAWQVALPRPIAAYDFAPPHGYVPAQADVGMDGGGGVPVGCRVLVPWQGELVTGLVVGAGSVRGGAHRLREVAAVLDSPQSPWVPPATVRAVCEWAAGARLPVGLAWSDLLSVGWQPALTHRVRVVVGGDLSAFAANAAPEAVPTHEWSDGAAYLPALLDAVREQGLLEEEFEPLRPTVTRIYAVQRGPKPEPKQSKLTPKQQEAAEYLAEHPAQESLAAWARGAGVSSSVVGAVLAKGYAELREEPAPPPPLPAAAPAWASAQADGPLPDTLPQAERWRLHGGRLAARLRALAPRIVQVLEAGGSVLVLAPEHATLSGAWALSGLVTGRLATETGTEAVQLSGQLSPEARAEAWARIGSGRARLVVGTYAALTAPFPQQRGQQQGQLQLLVLLEEGSDAYKLSSGTRAWVPDVAQAVAAAHGAALAAVGAVPAAEVLDWPAAELPPPRVRLHTVDYAAPPPQPELGPLSMPAHAQRSLGYPLSHDLRAVLRQVQERRRQAALLAPRRGYSALLRCPSCGHTPQCPNCDVSLRFHQGHRQLECHQCGFVTSVPRACPECGEAMWQTQGPGTEWVAQEVRKLMPDMPVYRLDKSHADDLSAMHAGESGVVVGTSMLLTQPAPPELALVAVTLADTWLNVPDFRAAERFHRLLWELAQWHGGRAPLLLVQTFQGAHAVLEAVRSGNSVSAFPKSELASRQLLGYPPYMQLAQIEVAARDHAKAHDAAEAAANALYAAGATPAEVLGPAPAPIARVRGLYTFHLLLRARHRTRLSELLGALEGVRGGRIRVDVSPRNVS